MKPINLQLNVLKFYKATSN